MNTAYEHTIHRDNGDKIIIKVEYAEWKNIYRIAYIGVLPKRKRNIQYLRFTDDYSYRCLDTAGRQKYLMKRYLEVVTVDEIKEAATRLWEHMKPNIESEDDLFNMA